MVSTKRAHPLVIKITKRYKKRTEKTRRETAAPKKRPILTKNGDLNEKSTKMKSGSGKENNKEGPHQ